MGEIDFVIADSNSVVPIEVKSGKDYERHNALTNVMNCAEYDITKAYVLYFGNIQQKGNVIYVPVYMTMCIQRNNDMPAVYNIDLSELQ